MTSKARRILADLFGQFMSEPDTLPTEWQTLITEQDSNSTKPRVIADYIAGMTDRFAIAEHQRFFDFHEP
jgi:dGTPase